MAIGLTQGTIPVHRIWKKVQNSGRYGHIWELPQTPTDGRTDGRTDSCSGGETFFMNLRSDFKFHDDFNISIDSVKMGVKTMVSFEIESFQKHLPMILFCSQYFYHFAYLPVEIHVVDRRQLRVGRLHRLPLGRSRLDNRRFGRKTSPRFPKTELARPAAGRWQKTEPGEERDRLRNVPCRPLTAKVAKVGATLYLSPPMALLQSACSQKVSARGRACQKETEREPLENRRTDFRNCEKVRTRAIPD